MSSIFYKRTIQWRLYYYPHPVRLLQVAIQQFSSSNEEKTIYKNSSDDQKAKWYQNGLHRPLLSGTNTFEKRNIFLM
jgi:hypothetical protein